MGAEGFGGFEVMKQFGYTRGSNCDGLDKVRRGFKVWEGFVSVLSKHRFEFLQENVCFGLAVTELFAILFEWGDAS